MGLFKLGVRSLLNRRFIAGLTVVTIAISTALMLGVEKIRHNARASFASTVSGADLIVGARTGPIQLLLYSVFRVGNATNNITWQSYQDIRKQSGVKWTIPISLGDSHRGYRVMGTSADYFDHFRYGNKRPLALAAGTRLNDLFDVVIGAEVACQLDYKIGQEIVLAHGLGSTSFSNHDDKPFRVAGILKSTGTPVDQTLHVSLEAIEAIHVDWRGGVQLPGAAIPAEQVRTMTLTPKAITAFIVGLDSRIAVFGLQRFINEYPEEPLLAVLPGVALQQLWDLMSVAEQALFMVSLFVVLAAFTGLIAVSLASLNERRREVAVLRAIGASYHHITALLVAESLVMTMAGIALGVALMYAGLYAGSPWIEARFGLSIAVGSPTGTEITMMLCLIVAGMLAGLVPAWRAYCNALIDGLTART